LWGSIGFIGAVALGGPVLDRLGTLTLPAWSALPLLLLLIIVWHARPVAEAASGVGRHTQRLRAQLIRPHIGLFFGANFLMIFSHAALYVLFSLYLESHGYSKTMIGLLWSVGVIAEIILFRYQRPLFERFSGLALLAFSMAVAAIRFALVGISDGALTVILVTQVMHMITFGLHHSAVMRVLHEWFDGRQQGRAQAMYLTIAYGCGGTAGGLALTAVWTQWSSQAAYQVAAFAAATGCCLALISRRRWLAADRSVDTTLSRKPIA
jgi:PPP family 3-phenylpropionic acid transporter